MIQVCDFVDAPGRPMNPIEAFIEAIDRAWPTKAASRIELRVLGSSALFLQCDYQRGTKDSDLMETAQVSARVRKGY